jgi:hypothetical protein
MQTLQIGEPFFYAQFLSISRPDFLKFIQAMPCTRAITGAFRGARKADARSEQRTLLQHACTCEC